MQSRAKIEITMVPRSLVPPLWMRAAFHMERGAEVGGISIEDEFSRLMSGLDDLWLIVEGGKIIGAFVTTIAADEDGRRFVNVSNLSGIGARRWVTQMGDKMAEFAHYCGCDRVRCYGKRGWTRLLSNVSVIGRHPGGHMIYERAAA